MSHKRSLDSCRSGYVVVITYRIFQFIIIIIAQIEQLYDDDDDDDDESQMDLQRQCELDSKRSTHSCPPISGRLSFRKSNTFMKCLNLSKEEKSSTL